jgi:carboxymethylenebutenolidase
MGEVQMPGPHGLLSGYLSVPADEDGRGPGVIVLPEAFGLNDDIRAHADHLATAGYVAFAPDLYAWGRKLRCVASTFANLARGSGRAFDDIEAGRAWLAAHERCTGRVGVIGFCMGGGFAIALAPRGGFASAAANYGLVPKDAARLLADACPIVGSYGAKDWMMRGHAGRLEEALTAAGIPHDVKEYPDAGHSFLNHHTGKAATMDRILRTGYTPASAEDAWGRILSFFADHLQSSDSS